MTRPASASTFFAPDSDTALLFNLVSNTASQLNELEKLVSNAEKYTGLMEKYNQIARDQYFRESLISAFRSLKSETESLKSLIREYRQDEAKNEYQEGVLGEKLRHSDQELNFANGQVIRSGEISQTNEAQKMTAQNTSLIYKSQVENNQISSAIAEKLTEQNKLKNRELKDEAIKKDERDAYYKIPNLGTGRSTHNRNN